MKRKLILIALLYSTSAFSQTKTEVLILGSPHLAQIDNMNPAYLERVLDSLYAKKFDVVAIEQMPAELLLDIKSRDEKHWQSLYDNFSEYVEFGVSYQKSMNQTYQEAKANIAALTEKEEVKDTEKIPLINSFLCTYDVWSALLHYQQLSDKSELDSAAAVLLERLSRSVNEINTIGVQVAKERGYKQIFYIDNLQDETILLNSFDWAFVQD